MAPAFVSSMPLAIGRTSTFGASVCTSQPRSSPVAKRTTGIVHMSAKKKEKQSLGDWLYSKFMHNAIWEGDQEAGFEPFFKKAMDAREEETKKAYAEEEKQRKQ